MFIVFDLEWNQSTDGREGAVAQLPFEIIEIGAVKLDSDLKLVDTFERIICPQVYKKMHFRVSEVVGLTIRELEEKGVPFKEAAEDFIKFCGDDPIFCTWGDGDLIQLERNMAYYGIDIPFRYPLLFYDVQKLYALLYHNGAHIAEPLDSAVAELNIKTDHPFHRALDDAMYTAFVMQAIDFEKVKPYLSVDYYRTPKNKQEEIYIEFPRYSKYISRPFATREELVSDKTVTDMVCCRCHRMLKKRVRWFTPNQKQYYCVAYCPQHKYLKGKIRIKHTDDDAYYTVKTVKLISEEDAVQIALKKQEVTRIRAEKRRRKRILKKKEQ